MKKICIINTGCGGHSDLFRQIIKSAEKEYEVALYPDEADYIIHFSCGFTGEQLNKLPEDVVYYEKLKKEGATLVFCGCGMSAYKKEIFEEMKVIDHVIVGMDILPKICEILGVTPTYDQHMDDNEGTLRIMITEGCYKPGGPCNFCKQNYLKIPMKSRYSIEQICEMVEHHGKPIVILGGMNTTNYGLDFGNHKPKLHDLIREVSKLPTVKWIQIEGVASSCIYEELIEEIEHNDKVVYIQFFLQSGSDRMLEKMNVGSKIADNKKVLERLKGKIIDGGVIIGHPGETIQDVLDTIQLIKDYDLWYTVVMSYKDTFMTPSGKMDKLSAKEYDEHCNLAIKALDEFAYRKMSELAKRGIIGYVSQIYPYKNSFEALVKPLQFEGFCYVQVDNASVKLGDKVIVRNSRISDLDHRSFEGGLMEVYND